MSRKEKVAKIEIPEFIVDTATNKKYLKGKFLGRGGFAKCFELIKRAPNEVFAGKVIAKAQFTKSEHKRKMSQEISIHRSVKHKNIVQFNGFFEDENFIYIVLELCSKQTLMEMHKRRKYLSEPEVRYFVRQVADACDYLHHNKIIHRDLKLGNIFLNEALEIKVGDFGLATRVSNDNERKQTLCGTPNYIAPEILMKKGHDYKVDVWSLGCIVYTLFVGKPPFETSDIKETYKRIRCNEYHIPSSTPPELTLFIKQMLRSDPEDRPTMRQILDDNYMKNYIPSKLPISCLTMAPHYNQGRLSIMPAEVVSSPRRPLTEVNCEQLVKTESINPKKANSPPIVEQRNNYYLHELQKQIAKVLEVEPALKESNEDEAEDPSVTPIFWISRWVDNTEKYGLSYQLCDNSSGCYFNDGTRMALFADEFNIQYIEHTGVESFYTIDSYPQNLHKKIKLVKYFLNYMNEYLMKTGNKEKTADDEDISRLPQVNKWFKTSLAMIFQLTNGTVQINFVKDHTKLILCPHMAAVTFVDENREFHTYRFSLIEKYGVNKNVVDRLRYAHDTFMQLLSQKPKVSSKSSGRS